MMKNLKTMMAGAILSVFLAANAYAGHPVNINQANAAQIAEALDGVGQDKAQLIVKYREAHGKFASSKDLLKVKGIGEKTLQKNSKNILLK